MNINFCKNLILNAVRSRCRSRTPPDPFFLSAHFCSLSTIDKNTVFDILLKHEISSGIASNVASKLREWRHHPQKCDSMLSFLYETGFSKSQVEKILSSRPRFLTARLDHTIKPKIQGFRDLGFSISDIADIISSDPLILTRSFENRVVPSIMALKDILGSTSEVVKLIRRPYSGLFLRSDLEKNLLPNIRLLEGCGISRERLIKNMSSVPRFMLNRTERMKELIDKVCELGCDRDSMMFLHAVRTIVSMSTKNWELKWGLFLDLGLSEDEVLQLFQKKPHIFAISGRKIKEVLKILLNTGMYDMKGIFLDADVFICSIEKRLRPRLGVLVILENRKLLVPLPKLSKVYKSSNAKFFEYFIAPYLSEVAELQLACEKVWANEISNTSKRKA